MRNLVFRADGKMVNVARRQGQLFVCTGCCCGHTERGHAPVPTELYHNEWERRKLRNRVHLTIGGCLGPCALANVVMLLFDGRALYFHSMNREDLVLALYDYIEQMLAADTYLPPPPALAPLHFTALTWEARPDGQPVEDRRRERGGALGGFLFLTHSDTDLLTLARVIPRLPGDFPRVRAFNLLHLKTDAHVDALLDAELPEAEVVIARLLGGRASFAHGLDRLTADAAARGTWLVCLPGTDALDPELTALSNVGVPVAHEAFAYLQFGGPDNYEHLLRFLSDHLLATGYGYEPPAEQPRHGLYHPDVPEGSLAAWRARHDLARPTVGLLFYRSHFLSGNTAFVDELVRAGERAGLNVLPVYAYSLKDTDESDTGAPGPLPAALRYFLDQDGRPFIDVLITTMSFAMGGVSPDGQVGSAWATAVLERLDVPVLQAITASGPRAAWEESLRGLSPLDAAMNVMLPEFDGRILTVPVSFKEETAQRATSGDGAAAPVMRYVPDPERCDRLMALAARLAALRRKPNHEKRVAFVLTNSTARISRIGNAVGLDAPASLVRLLEAMRAHGYRVEGVPATGDELIHALLARCSYDTEFLTEAQLAQAAARVPAATYATWFESLPERNRREMAGKWGPPPGVAYVHDDHLALAGLEFGNVFVALQPPRGYGMDPNAIYHMPDLPPPHYYHALYRWLRDDWGADAIVHLGKHGTLEWLPGKAAGPGPTCYPDQFLSDLPLVYPFIINNPGEGAQAKRRTHAVIVDHLTPPMTSAGAYDELAELAQLIDEYYQVEMLDPEKLPLLQRQIWDVIERAHLEADIEAILNRQSSPDHTHSWDPSRTEEGTPVTLTEMRGKDLAHLLQEIDGYLCELAGAQIRDGLHVLGQVPEDEQLVDLLAALVRVPNLEVPGMRGALCAHFGLDLDALLAAPAERVSSSPGSGLERLARLSGRQLRIQGDVIAALDEVGRRLIAALAEHEFAPHAVDAAAAAVLGEGQAPEDVRRVLAFIGERLLPALQRTTDEIAHVLRALDGRYVPPGPSGAPTRGMAHVLPTGRNFYAVDPRTLPSVAAWQVGQQLAAALIERYRQDEGRYPESVGISIWGTSAMRTHGDDVAQVFALLGVRPRWQPENRRVLGIEVIPLAELGRPRIDVVCRISGFFRDAFPYLIALLDEAVRTVAHLDEPPEQNFVRKRYLERRAALERTGAPAAEAERRALYRVFGCKPGTYGAGILPLIDERNWTGVADFAEAYINWGGYAYTGSEYGVDARPDFETALAGVVVAVKNQDNREHDIFDSDDYLQYHGGMIATIRALTGRMPRRYFGDSADPAHPRVRDLKEEALRVFRSRVVNPKWIAAMRRHGYKGGLELAATVDYLFGYDATAKVVDGWMYARVAQAYVFDAETRDFLHRANPWALRDIAGRLLEAAERGLWERPDEALLAALRGTVLEVEGDLEAHDETPPAKH